MNNELNLCRKKKKKKPSLKQLIDTWNKLPKSETEKYTVFTKEIKEEQNNLQDLYDIIRGVKPKIPAGAYRTFLEEKASKGIISSMSEGEKLWDSLSNEEKEKYIGYCHRKVLAYKYKKLIYQKKIRGILPKKPCGALQLFYKKIKGLKCPNNENVLIYYKSYMIIYLMKKKIFI